MVLPVPVSIGERLWGIPWGIPRDPLDPIDSWLIPMVFHVLINGRVARLKRVGSHGHVGSCGHMGSHGWSHGTRTGERSRDTSRVPFL